MKKHVYLSKYIQCQPALIMKKLLLIGFCLLVRFNSYSQDKAVNNINPIDCFNSFQKYSEVTTTPNADSAFYFLKKLASNSNYIFLLRELIHHSFAQAFIQSNSIDTNEIANIVLRQQLSNEILTKAISDTSKLLQETIKPMYLWVMVQKNKENVTVLSNLTNEFIKTELALKDVYTNSTARYGLLIYQIISTHPELKHLAEELFAGIYADLKNNQVVVTDSSSRDDLDKRAYYRYLYAYTNYLKAIQTNEINKKEQYLKAAFDYSPDIIDKNHRSAYFYDACFLFNREEKETFKPDYLQLLVNRYNDKSKILPLLLDVALTDPQYKPDLRELYNKTSTTKGSFNDYWQNAINYRAKPAPPIFLHLLDEKIFNTKDYLGKWVFIDFWGTWCAVCRAEHPEMQKFYDSVILKNSKKISFVAIACNDTKEKVLDYLNNNHFTFPVAMSDHKVENIYHVQGYPTKILITPKGKYLIVPFGIDWENLIKQYSDL